MFSYTTFLNAFFLLSTLLPLMAYSTPISPNSISARQGPTQCTTLTRKAWHTLTKIEQKAYIDAELCLMKLPTNNSRSQFAKTRFDDLQAVHQLQGPVVHRTGYFLPFHRLMVHAHEYLLRTECGYSGAQPYWDEPREAGNFKSSLVFSTDAFGGDGGPKGGVVAWSQGNIQHSAGCIKDGPFKDYTLNIGPGSDNKAHCISRNISDEASTRVSLANVQECLNKKTFKDAWNCIEAKPHYGGHRGVGGEMWNPFSSPGDPIFYLHHAWLDKVWWQWQSGDLTARVRDITGPKRMGPNPPEGMVALKDLLYMHDIIRDARVEEVMDLSAGLTMFPRGERFCFVYQ